MKKASVMDAFFRLGHIEFDIFNPGRNAQKSRCSDR
jgi:hypothetical protein